MRVVLLSSPGAEPALHWSFALGERLHSAMVDAGHEVRWLAPVVAGAGVPAQTAAEVLRVGAAPLHRVGDAILHDELERELANDLRARAADLVLHVGLGARGSANLLWLADRMGSRALAVVRAAEVLCHRGDLVDHRGESCTAIDDAERCRRCCSKGLRRAGHADLATRLDLLVCCLQVSAAVFVETATEVSQLEQVGVPRRLLHVAAPDEVAAAVLTRLAPASLSDA
ncbi:MAG: hypothetical protein H6838_13545 [Planctomycetes bacterium]|nr:hypothetical protein [Planctomycetota bacterium]MCB9886512.1 hypothetical protein [Planctomycetota bacterium]